MFNIKKQLEDMKEYLKERTDFEVVRGYTEAKADFERTNNPMIEGALEVIIEELHRRGIKESDIKKDWEEKWKTKLPQK